MAYNEAETRYELIDPILREKGYRQWRVKLETPAPVEPTGNKGRRRSGNGRTDYLLCVQAGDMPKPLPVGVIEAKAETEDPLKGMEQGKRYAECVRFAVQYVFATNGHRYGEFDLGTRRFDVDSLHALEVAQQRMVADRGGAAWRGMLATSFHRRRFPR